MSYLMVLPVEFFRVSDEVVATESAFRDHLRLLQASLGGDAGSFTIAAPRMTLADYQRRQGYLAEINEPEDRVRYVALEPAGSGRVAYWFRHLPRNVVKIWRQVRKASVVHAGPSHIYGPREILAILFAVMQRKMTVFVVDIDWRRSAWMNRQTGRYSLKSYLLSTFLYNPFFSMQVRFACRFCSLVLLKSQKLVDDYGHGRPNVRNFLDAAHSREHIITAQALSEKSAAQRSATGPLRLVYFGRLTAYKGIAHMIDAIARVRDMDGPQATLDVIGTGEQLEELRQQAADTDLGNLVRFHGPVTFGPELFDLLRSFDVLLAAPLAADTPRNALDAMASGLPILAYDTDYYVDLGRASGAVTVVPWMDRAALAQAIADLGANRAEVARMSQSAVAFASHNTQEVWLETRAGWIRERNPRQAGPAVA